MDWFAGTAFIPKSLKNFANSSSDQYKHISRPRNRKLDIVIAHHASHNLAAVVEVWSSVLQQPSVVALNPYIFLYCQNVDVTDDDLSWFADRGEVRHLANIGRESHVYLWHLVSNYNDVALHTLFHQDLPDDREQMMTRLSYLTPQTGMLALSEMCMCSCEACVITDIPKMKEIWAMIRKSFCSPQELHPVFLRGAFVVSSKRISNNSVVVYNTLLEYVEAPEGHWIHSEHPHDWGRSVSSPVSAHVLERAWNVIFNCLTPNGPQECSMGWTNGSERTVSACQCQDTII